MPNAPQPSIRFFLAREAPVAVLLRRGPSKLVQCLLWNLETDQVTSGQWLSGRVHEERCDLSPDGKLFVYFAANYRDEERSWTAISRPPYFTALALWFKGPTYNGGGLFDDSSTVRINDLSTHIYSERFPKPRVRVGSFLIPTEHVEEFRMVRDGWNAERTHAKPRVLTKSVGRLELSETLKTKSSMEVRMYTASIDGQPIDTQGAKQIDIDALRSRIVYTIGGKVLAASADGLREITDLTDNRFEEVPPPEWATQWP